MECRGWGGVGWWRGTRLCDESLRELSILLTGKISSSSRWMERWTTQKPTTCLREPDKKKPKAQNKKHRLHCSHTAVIRALSLNTNPTQEKRNIHFHCLKVLFSDLICVWGVFLFSPSSWECVGWFCIYFPKRGVKLFIATPTQSLLSN